LSNEPRCTSCHAGYGWTDMNYDFTKQDNVDCLACHDNTGTYKKFGTDAGHPSTPTANSSRWRAAGQKAFKAPTSPGSLST
jgi:hypothetical protein